MGKSESHSLVESEDLLINWIWKLRDREKPKLKYPFQFGQLGGQCFHSLSQRTGEKGLVAGTHSGLCSPKISKWLSRDSQICSQKGHCETLARDVGTEPQEGHFLWRVYRRGGWEHRGKATKGSIQEQEEPGREEKDQKQQSHRRQGRELIKKPRRVHRLSAQMAQEAAHEEWELVVTEWQGGCSPQSATRRGCGKGKAKVANSLKSA